MNDTQLHRNYHISSSRVSRNRCAVLEDVRTKLSCSLCPITPETLYNILFKQTQIKVTHENISLYFTNYKFVNANPLFGSHLSSRVCSLTRKRMRLSTTCLIFCDCLPANKHSGDNGTMPLCVTRKTCSLPRLELVVNLNASSLTLIS